MNRLVDFYKNWLGFVDFYDIVLSNKLRDTNEFIQENMFLCDFNQKRKDNSVIINTKIGDSRIDVPVWFGNLETAKVRIIVFGLEPRDSDQIFNIERVDDKVFAAPFGIDRWNINSSVKNKLQNKYYRVFETVINEPDTFVLFSDIVKDYYISSDKDSKTENDTLARKNFVDKANDQLKWLFKEVELIDPTHIFTLGEESYRIVNELFPDKTYKLRHPSHGGESQAKQEISTIIDNMRITVQEQIIDRIKESNPDAVANMVNKGNSIEIRIPSVSTNKGHYFVANVKDEKKMFFYFICRDAKLISNILKLNNEYKPYFSSGVIPVNSYFSHFGDFTSFFLNFIDDIRTHFSVTNPVSPNNNSMSNNIVDNGSIIEELSIGFEIFIEEGNESFLEFTRTYEYHNSISKFPSDIVGIIEQTFSETEIISDLKSFVEKFKTDDLDYIKDNIQFMRIRVVSINDHDLRVMYESIGNEDLIENNLVLLNHLLKGYISQQGVNEQVEDVEELSNYLSDWYMDNNPSMEYILN